jgi:hypothetical protein
MFESFDADAEWLRIIMELKARIRAVMLADCRLKKHFLTHSPAAVVWTWVRYRDLILQREAEGRVLPPAALFAPGR